MSARNRPAAKKLRRALKTLRDRPARYIDLIEWLQMRHRMSKGKARGIIMAECVKVDSHVVGKRIVTDERGFSHLVCDPYIPASVRGRITVVDPPAHLSIGVRDTQNIENLPDYDAED